MTCTDYQARIDTTKALIQLYEDALAGIAESPNKSYTVNTGQTVTTVSKHTIKEVMETLERLYASLEFWCGRLNQTGGVVYASPGF